MRVLSIDQSFTNSAWSIWEGDKLYDFGVITSPKNEQVHLRLKKVIQELRQVILENEIEFLVLEGLAMGNGVGTSARSLGALFYAIQVLCDDLEIPFEDIPPKTVKKIWTGSGNSDKKAMEVACPEYLMKVIEESEFKTLAKGRRDLVDSFAIYKSWRELYGKDI